MSKPKQIPIFASEAEERRFWETHDSTEYVDWSRAERVRFPNLKLSTTSISLRLPVAMLERIKIAANKRDMPYQSLIKAWLAEKIETSLPAKVALDRSPETLQLIHDRYQLARQRTNINVPPDQEKVFFADLVDEIVGFGPLEKILNDESVTEVMVNRADLIYVEQKGRISESGIRFVDDAHVERVINKIIKPLGRYISRDSPLVDARLPDGSRVNAVIAPCAIDGPNITIRKFSKNPFGIQDLINFGSMNQDMADFLKACVVSKLNVVVAGGTGSG